ncbi:MAG: beta-lactamase family protein [Pseudomonadota bacterium]|nr:beta-lactamase family protein [Pseudomonadota bacterium]
MTARPSFPALAEARPEEVGLSAAGLARLSRALTTRIERGHIPGAVALIARGGRLAFHEAFGARDPAAAGDPMRTDAIFRIYSMTKPIVSVAAMMLWEEGRFLLGDPVPRTIPDFAAPKVLSAQAGKTEPVPAQRAITVQDLLRHTSGLTYEFLGGGPVHRAYMDAKIYRRRQTNADQAAMLGKLPLLYQPRTRWEYSRSTDVVGHLVEVLSGEPLGPFLQRRILGPLGMADSGFYVPADAQNRLAGGFGTDPETGADVPLLDVREAPSFESGGGGMVSTALDYARFLQMLLDGGALNGERLLGRKTIELMTADHLGGMPANADLLPPGHGFGLGFAVRLVAGLAPFPGSVGSYFWGGAAGTTFWVDPAEGLIAVLMIQAPGQREHYRVLFRDLVYAAIAD